MAQIGSEQLQVLLLEMVTGLMACLFPLYLHPAPTQTTLPKSASLLARTSTTSSAIDYMGTEQEVRKFGQRGFNGAKV